MWERLQEDAPRWALAVFSASAALWASAPGVIKVLLIAMGADYVSGVLAALATGEGLASRRGKHGLVVKLLILLALGLAHALDTYLLGLSGVVSITAAFAVQFTANEVISFLENCGRAGLPLPVWLAQMLTELRDNLGERVVQAIARAIDKRFDEPPPSGGGSFLPANRANKEGDFAIGNSEAQDR